jgi:hypothetical protein
MTITIRRTDDESRLFLALCCALALALCGPVLAADVRMPKIVALVQRADDIYAQAANIVANTPHNSTAADALAGPGGAGRVFHADERRFQDAINFPPTMEITSPFSQGAERLGQFYNIVYDAVVDAMC